jgi:peptidylprolyl isomerase
LEVRVLPQSRHRKTAKARKRPKGLTAQKTGSPQAKNERRVKSLAIVVVAALLLSGAAYLIATRQGGAKEVTLPDGLKYTDLVEGTGPSPQLGHKITVRYSGKLENGDEFDSSRGQPVDFDYNSGRLIAGWIEGLRTMKTGGKRTLIVPGKLGYGPAGNPPKIGPNATLIFEVELVGVK